MCIGIGPRSRYDAHVGCFLGRVDEDSEVYFISEVRRLHMSSIRRLFMLRKRAVHTGAALHRCKPCEVR